MYTCAIFITESNWRATGGRKPTIEARNKQGEEWNKILSEFREWSFFRAEFRILEPVNDSHNRISSLLLVNAANYVVMQVSGCADGQSFCRPPIPKTRRR